MAKRKPYRHEKPIDPACRNPRRDSWYQDKVKYKKSKNDLKGRE